MSAPGSAPTPPSGYPITFTFDPPERVARWRPLVHWLLAIPHLVILYVLSIVAAVLVFLSWFAGVFAGKNPEGLQKPVAMVLRYNSRVVTYLLFLRAEYPPFSFDGTFADPGDDARVRVDITPQIEGRSRLTILFRFLMVIPHYIVLFFVGIAAFVVIAIGFFAVIILGRWPRGLRAFIVGYERWNLRLSAYLYLLTDDYPPFGLD